MAIGRHGGGAAGRARRSAPACALRPVALTELSRVAVACRARGVLSETDTETDVDVTRQSQTVGYVDFRQISRATHHVTRSFSAKLYGFMDHTTVYTVHSTVHTRGATPQPTSVLAPTTSVPGS